MDNEFRMMSLKRDLERGKNKEINNFGALGGRILINPSM